MSFNVTTTMSPSGDFYVRPVSNDKSTDTKTDSLNTPSSDNVEANVDAYVKETYGSTLERLDSAMDKLTEWENEKSPSSANK